MPDLRVIDTSFVPFAMIDNCESIKWPRKLWEIGSIEIHISPKKTGAKELQDDRIVFLDDRRAGIITKIKVDESKKGADWTAYAMELKGIVSWRRTIPDQIADTQYYGWDRYPALTDPDAPAESVIKHYVDRHMVNPSDPNRKFTGLIIAPDLGRGPSIRWQSRFEQLDTVFKEIGEQTGMGYEIRLDLENGLFVFDVIPSVDKSAASENPVIFGVKWSNVDKTEYIVDKSKWYNAGYAGGAGEDEGRLIQTVYEDDTITSGWGRRETFLDCGTIDMVDDLIYEGKYKLMDSALSKSLSADTLSTGPFKYMTDWDLGNIVTIQSLAADAEADMQITGVEEAYEKGYHPPKITFGKKQKTILDEIRKIGVIR
jgi:hypothetical protein